MQVWLKSIERVYCGAARVTFDTESGSEFSFVIAKVHAQRVCKNIIDFAFGYGNEKLDLEIVKWERTGKDSIVLTNFSTIDNHATKLQITHYEMGQEANNG